MQSWSEWVRRRLRAVVPLRLCTKCVLTSYLLSRFFSCDAHLFIFATATDELAAAFADLRVDASEPNPTRVIKVEIENGMHAMRRAVIAEENRRSRLGGGHSLLKSYCLLRPSPVRLYGPIFGQHG